MVADPFVSVLGRLGPRFDPAVLEATIAHWKPRVALRQKQQSPSIDDIEYGGHTRHRMDLFPVQGSGAPIVLFVHGGGFIAGDKQAAPPFYANVGRYFAAHGMLGACMNYRLAPTGGWPAAAQDIDSAVRWLLDRGDLYGGDPNRLVVLGQSAGACHVATWLLEPRFAGGPRESLRATILMSGFFRAQAPLSPGQRAFFGDDERLYSARSPISMARKLGLPLLVTIAEHDPPSLRAQGRELAEALVSAGCAATLVDMPHHNHVSPLMSLGSDNDEVGARLRQFVAQATAADQLIR
ncbi:MAG: alpha/beta hydrolase [Burkholderiales bacterium]|nr:alpha/beta hydrolase [Burkholderiales bacterium]